MNQNAKEWAARGAAAGLAVLLLLAFFFLPFVREEHYAGDGGRKKADIPTEGEISWSWTPHLERVGTLTLTLSGVKKAAGMTVHGALRGADGAVCAEASLPLADGGENFSLQGSFSRNQAYTLSLRAEGEGTIRVKGSEQDGVFEPLLQESGTAETRNPALLYFAAGLALLAVIPVYGSGRGARKQRKGHSGENLLAWGTFLLVLSVGVILSLNKPVPDAGSDWKTWDEQDAHQFVLSGMLPGGAESLPEWLSRVITWYPGYLPLALGGALAGLFTADAAAVYRAAILMSSLFYAAAAGLAVKHAPRYKATFLAAGTLPAILFQMTSRTYDTVVTGCILLGLALALECMEREERVTPLRAMFMAGLTAFGTVAKPAYSVVLLILLMIPADRFGGGKRAWAFRAYVLVLLAWCIAALAVPGAYDSVSGGDERFAGANAAEQIAWIQAHPGEGLSRPLLYFWERQETLMNMGIAHWAYLGNDTERGGLYLALLLLAAPLCARSGEEERSLLTPGRRAALAAVALGAELILIMTQFIVSSPVGGEIEGMQARYFIPLWGALALALMAPRGIRRRISPAAGGVLTAGVFAACACVNVSYALYWLSATGCL